MNTKIASLVILLALAVTTGFGQEKSKKQIKEEQKIEKQKQTEALINSKEFVFIATTAFPQGYPSVNLASNPNFVKFSPDLVKSYMPYYGKAYSGVGYGGDTGLKYEAKPEEFTITKGKKNFEVKAVVKGDNDSYTLMLTVTFEGSASLYINSHNRSPISYNGEIFPPGYIK